MKIETEIDVQLAHGSGPNGPRWFLEITDRRSRSMIVRAHIPDAHMGRALGSQQITVPAEVWRDDHLGQWRENQTRAVPMPRALAFNDFDPEAWRAAVFEWQADQPDLEGWIPRIEPKWNGHRYTDGAYSVHFFRYVDAPPETYAEDLAVTHPEPELATAILDLINLRAGRYTHSPGAEQRLWDRLGELVGWEP